jgi:hypothetical protein
MPQKMRQSQEQERSPASDPVTRLPSNLYFQALSGNHLIYDMLKMIALPLPRV